MDGPSVDHSDSDSGESWTLLENNSISADESPEIIEEHEKQESRHNEKDDDTDGISIISDSDHEAQSPAPNETVFEKYQVKENNLTENEISDFVSVDPQLTNYNSDDHEPVIDQDIKRYDQTKHKTYVHRRNKRLSTVLNIIVLGSVITAAGVAIGHMWGARYDCTMQTTSSVNKILSNLYKLQEENAYLRGKLKELAFVNNRQIYQQPPKTPSKHNKCKKVFEEALNSNGLRKHTKCVDDNYNNADYNLIEHIRRPKFEKEFIADIDKLKTVYLQNKSWLDDEISRRMKIEEELLKKYNDEVNSARVLKKDSLPEEQEPDLEFSDTELPEKKSGEKFVDLEHLITDVFVENKLPDTESSKTEQKPRFRRNEERYETIEENDWLKAKESLNLFDEDIKIDFPINDKSKPGLNSNIGTNGILNVASNDNLVLESEVIQNDNNNDQEKNIYSNEWAETKPKFRRNEERYETEYENTFSKPKQDASNNPKENVKYNGDRNKENTQERYEKRYGDEADLLKNAQEPKNTQKKEKSDNEKNSSKRNSDTRKNDSNAHKTLEFAVGDEDLLINNRYVINKFKQEGKKKEYANSNKKQKRKNKFKKWNMKGEFDEKFEPVVISEDFALNYPHKSFDSVSSSNFEDTNVNNDRNKLSKLHNKGEIFDVNSENDIQAGNWFEKRSAFRTEARKKYHDELGNTSPNNSSWYFRRMRKREQCRAKRDNSTFRKIHKSKKITK